jgi:hypothetical protein
MSKGNVGIFHFPSAHHLQRTWTWLWTKHPGHLPLNTVCTEVWGSPVVKVSIMWHDVCGVWLWKSRKGVSWLISSVLWCIYVKGFIEIYLVNHGANFNWWAVVFSCLCDQGICWQLWRSTVQESALTSTWGCHGCLREGGQTSVPFGCHQQGHWFEIGMMPRNFFSHSRPTNKMSLC